VKRIDFTPSSIAFDAQFDRWSAMKIRLKMFAILRERSGVAETELELAEGATVADAVRAVGKKFSILTVLLPRTAAAVNLEYAKASDRLHAGDELARVPPVSGGWAMATEGVTIRELEEGDLESWLEMRRALWPEATAAELEEDVKPYWSRRLIQGLRTVVLIAEKEGKGVGFAEISLRPVAAGCATSPVGYLEAWYVAAEFRRRGIGGALVKAGEQWARSRGCKEFGSDCYVSNDLSRAAHGRLAFSVNERVLTFRKQLEERSRGAADFIGVVPFEILTGVAVELVSDGAAGGIAVFLGTTREDRDSQGKALEALDYEVYPEMAERQLRDLARQAREKWPIVKLVMLHRVGRVGLGEASVLIAVSTPHRGEAFEACEFLIDRLKADVTIWKKEVWNDGSASWVEGHPGGDWLYCSGLYASGMLFQLVQTVYWLALSTWFGGAMFIGVAAQAIHRTVRENKPVLPHVLSVNLEDQHSTLLAGTIVGNLILALTKIEIICAGVLLVVIAAQWFLIDLSDSWVKVSAFVRTALYLAATAVVIYDGWVLWPRIMKSRQAFIDDADDPDKANPINEQLEKLQRGSEMLLMILVFLLLGIILFSGNIYRPITFRSGGWNISHGQDVEEIRRAAIEGREDSADLEIDLSGREMQFGSSYAAAVAGGDDSFGAIDG
jgi:molybdopterin synthase catalytic subunit/molybdopterin converting factor small subunit/GNAT superfamily N-acetyltransferase